MAQQDNYIGIAMGLDVTDLKAGLNETKKAITTANKEFRAATSGMDDWKTSSEGLKAKLAQLDTVLENQKRNLAGYEAELARAESQENRNEEQIRKLKDKILDAKAAIGDTTKQQRKYTQQLAQVESGEKDVTNETRDMSKAMKNADKSTSSLKDGFSVLKGAMANLVSTGITSMVSGLKSIVSESREFRREMAYLEQTADATGASFERAKENVKEVTSITEDQGAAIEGLNNLMTAGFDGDALDQITDQLVGASIKWKDTLKFEGLADGLQETLATGSAVGPFVELLERAGMVADDFDAGLQACTTDAEKQNYVLETLSKLGLKEIKDGYVENNQALVDGAKANIEYSEAMASIGEKAEPTLTAVKRGWVDVLNAFMSSADGMDTADFNGKIKDAFSWFINNCVPVIKSALSWIIDHLNIVVPIIGAVGGAFAVWKVSEIVKGAVDGIKGLVDVMGKLKLSTVASTASLVAQKIAMVASTVAMNAMAVAQRALNLVMSMNPIGLIITAIGALVVAFVTLWNKSEAFREFWIGLWEKIKGAVQPVIDFIVMVFSETWDKIKAVWSVVVEFFTGIWTGIKDVFSAVVAFFSGIFTDAWDRVKKVWSVVTEFFSGIWKGITKVFSKVANWFKNKFTQAWTNIKNAWSGVKQWFSGIWTGIKNVFSGVASTLGGFFRKAWTNIKNAWSGVKQWFSDIVDKIVGFFKDIPSKMIQIGKDIVNGLINGIKNTIGGVGDAIKKGIGGAIDKVKNFLGIHSPSTKMRDEIGEPMGEGISEGVKSTEDQLAADATAMVSKIVTDMRGKLQSAVKELEAEYQNAVGDIVANNPISIPSKTTDIVSSDVSTDSDSESDSESDYEAKLEALKAGAAARRRYDEIIDLGRKALPDVAAELDRLEEAMRDLLSLGIGKYSFSELEDLRKKITRLEMKLDSAGSDIRNGRSDQYNPDGTPKGSTSVTYNYTQTINAPKQPSRLELYRDTKNLLKYQGGY